MAKDKTQMLRLIFIDQKIRHGMRSGFLTNCQTMAREYEVSPKSILRDIDYLKNQRDAPIAYDPVRKGYYYTEANFALPALSINESDLFAICLAEQALRQYKGTSLYGRLKKIFSKIEEGLPHSVSFFSFTEPLPITFLHRGQSKVNETVWEAISESLKKKKSLFLKYRKPADSDATSRKVDPFKLISYQGEWYLIGHCHLRKKVLTFALSRIQEARRTNQACQYSEPEDLEWQLSRNFGIFSSEGPFAVQIRFSSKVAHIVRERKWHPKQEIVENKDGSVLLNFEGGDLHEIKRWVLSWGGDALIEKPEELKSLTRTEIGRMQKLYS
jgi:predicted DNA-binding transcriptional regulator YafY